MKEIDLSKIDYIELITKISELQSRVINVGERALLMRYVHEKETRDSSITDVEFEEPIIKENKVIRTQTMTIKVDHLEDGGFNVYRTNDGFNSMELLGQIDFMAREIVKQLSGDIKPDVIKRTVIVD